MRIHSGCIETNLIHLPTSLTPYDFHISNRTQKSIAKEKKGKNLACLVDITHTHTLV